MNDKRMKDALESIAQRGIPENTNLWPGLAARLERKSPMTVLRARPLAAVLIALLVLLTLSGVAYAIGRSLGYIPGVGLFEQAQPNSLRILASPVRVQRENIDLQIEQIIAASDKTVVVYQYVILDAANLAALQPGSGGHPSLILPDGSRLEASLGRRLSGNGPAGGDDYPVRYLLEFPALPQDVLAVTLEIPSLPFSYEDGPRDWQIPLTLMPAPEGSILPVYEVEEAGDGSADATAPSPNIPSAGTNVLHGITATLDLYVPMDDGYLLIGSMQWSAQDYPARAVQPSDFYMRVTDATGREVDFEPFLGPLPEKPQDEDFRSYWVLKVLEKDFVAPLRIRIDSVSVSVEPWPAFQFDPGPAPAPGQSWEIGQDFQVGDVRARLSSVTLTVQDSDLVFEFLIQAQPNELADVYLHMDIAQCMSGGGSISPEPSETILSSVYTCRADLPAGSLKAEVSGALIWGPWQVEWTPPADTDAAAQLPSPTPITHPEACIRMDKLTQALNEKPILPQGLSGRVLLYDSYQASIVNLDGSSPLPISDGDGDFSPDGSKVAFSRSSDDRAESGIFIMDLGTSQVVHLPGTESYDFNPMWSPDSSQIVFNRGGGIFDLYVVNVDGTNLRRLTYDPGQEFPIGWLPDGQRLLYVLPGAGYQQTNHIVNVQSGKIEYASNDEILGISTDALHKVTAERDPTNMDSWVSYFGSMDGSNRWPLAENGIILQYPIWGVDGEWLLVSVSKLYEEKSIPVFVHLTDCQLIPLPQLDGVVLDWLP